MEVRDSHGNLIGYQTNESLIDFNTINYQSNLSTWMDFNQFKNEILEEIKYMKDFLIYKKIMIDEKEFKNFVISQKVSQKLYETVKTKKYKLESDNDGDLNIPFKFAYQNYLKPTLVENDKE